jgi:hypothetical protein
MTCPFPPPIPPQISLLAFAVNLLGMLLVLLATLGEFRRMDRPTRRALWMNWGISVALVAAVAGFGMASDETRLYMPAYFVVIWLVIGPACLISLAISNRPTAGTVLGWIFLVGLVVLLILPAYSPARQAGWRSQCKQNLKVMGLAYIESQENQRGPLLLPSEGDPSQSWRTKLYNQDNRGGPVFDEKRAWDELANLALARTDPHFCRCPANFHPTDDTGRYLTAYAAITGPQTAFPNGRALPVARISDGLSNTIIFGEAAGLRIVWTEPRDINVSREPIGINLPGMRRLESPGTLSSYHDGGALVALADGSVRFLASTISPTVLKALLTATGGESIAEGW